MSESVAFTVWGNTHEECVAAAIEQLPEHVGRAASFTVQRDDDLVRRGSVTWALTDASSRKNVMPTDAKLVCDVTFTRYG